MENGKPFYGGTPVGPDVEKLIKDIGKPGPGLIDHARIETCIGLSWGSNRYRTVVDAWRRRLLKEHNIDTMAVPSVGIRVLNDNERVDVSQDEFSKTRRRLVRTGYRLSAIDPSKLVREKLAQRDALSAAVAKSVSAASAGLKSVNEAIKATPQLPRPTLLHSQNGNK